MDAERTVMAVLMAISLSHLLNDTLQSVLPAIYPTLQKSLSLSFAQIGMITFTFQVTGSLFQPLVGLYTDKNPKPYSLAIGMTLTLCGVVLLSRAPSFSLILVSAGLIGLGSSIFHPEASRIAYLASGGRRGFAQSFFQVGGNAGSSLGPLLAALVITGGSHGPVIWFAILAVIGIVILAKVGGWYREKLSHLQARTKSGAAPVERSPLSRGRVTASLAVLMVLIFSKYFYLASLTSYYTFFLIRKFGVSDQSAQIHLFVFLFAVAAGTILGGPLGDRFGRKRIIWFSILGAAPFSLLLPHVGLTGVGVLSVFIGMILASAFSAILVYAQELVPGKVGMIAGLFFGFAFGMAGVAAAILGWLADRTSIEHVFDLCAWLPLIGLITGFLPDIGGKRRAA